MLMHRWLAVTSLLLPLSVGGCCYTRCGVCPGGPWEEGDPALVAQATVPGGCPTGPCCYDGCAIGGCLGRLFRCLTCCLSCGSGCGEVYWNDWINDPPTCDPCDGCGRWSGSAGCCTGRFLYRHWSAACGLFGRLPLACGGCGSCHPTGPACVCGQDGCDGCAGPVMHNAAAAPTTSLGLDSSAALDPTYSGLVVGDDPTIGESVTERIRHRHHLSPHPVVSRRLR
jgi:hypothetical protein